MQTTTKPLDLVVVGKDYRRRHAATLPVAHSLPEPFRLVDLEQAGKLNVAARCSNDFGCFCSVHCRH